MPKNYLIVGGSSGIGLALTRQLATAGHDVYVASRTAESVQSIQGVEHITFDALGTDPLTLDLEHLDGLAYCPGSINLKPFHRLKTEDFLADFQLNALGAVSVIQQCLPLLKKADHASIVLFSTVAVQQGMSFHASIAMAKGALEGLTRSLAAELAPKIRVNCLAPSIVNTPLAGRLLSTEDKIEASAKRHALQRVGDSEDLANAGTYLLSEASSWVTGQILAIDGGMSSVKML
ncbi:MAG: SDR family oxidoreductase [Bacteroidota bacterium]